MKNFTDQLANFDDVPPPSEDSIGMKIHEIILTFFCVLGVCANLIIIYTLFRFRKMKIVPNVFLANWMIADIGYLIVLSIFYIIAIMNYFVQSGIPTIDFYCVLVQLEIASYFTTLVFVALISVDWLIAAYFRRAMEFFRMYYKYAIGSAWIFSLIFCGITMGMCFEKQSVNVAAGINIFTYCVISIFIATIQIYRALEKYKNRYTEYPTLMLTLSSIFMLSRAPQVIHHLVFLCFDVASLALTVIFDYFTPMNCILNLILLYCFNNDFQACLRQVFKRSDQGYMEATNAFENPEENDSAEFPVRMSLHNSTEELSTNTY